jgi:PqqA peptide cyclase
VRDRPLAAIWHHSEAFNAFRGTGWMPQPCRSCTRRELDHGGCRCQAFLLTGDAARTDPVCELAPDHHLITAALAETTKQRLRYRRFRSARHPTQPLSAKS